MSNEIGYISLPLCYIVHKTSPLYILIHFTYENKVYKYTLLVGNKMFCTFCFRSPLETLIRIHTFFFDMVQCIFVFPISVYLPRYQRFLNTLLLFLTRRYHYESLLSLYIAFLVKSGRGGEKFFRGGSVRGRKKEIQIGAGRRGSRRGAKNPPRFGL